MVSAVEISPAGAGVASLEIMLERQDRDNASYPPGWAWFRLAQATATPNAGFVFDHWESVTVGVFRGESGWPSNGQEYDKITKSTSQNPTPCNVRRETAFLRDYHRLSSVIVRDDDGVERYYFVDCTCVKVTAVFRRTGPEPPEPTGKGLIYSPGDGRLIYDIATGRPMFYD